MALALRAEKPKQIIIKRKYRWCKKKKKKTKNGKFTSAGIYFKGWRIINEGKHLGRER